MAPTPTVCAPAATAKKVASTNPHNARTKLRRIVVSFSVSCEPLGSPRTADLKVRTTSGRLSLAARGRRSRCRRKDLPAIELVQFVDDPRVGPGDLLEAARRHPL